MVKLWLHDQIDWLIFYDYEFLIVWSIGMIVNCE